MLMGFLSEWLEILQACSSDQLENIYSLEVEFWFGP